MDGMVVLEALRERFGGEITQCISVTYLNVDNVVVACRPKGFTVMYVKSLGSTIRRVLGHCQYEDLIQCVSELVALDSLESM